MVRSTVAWHRSASGNALHWPTPSWPAVPQALVSAKHFPQLICVMQQWPHHQSQSLRLTSNVWAGYSPRLLRARYAPATRPLRARYAPATRPLRARYAPATARYAPSIYMCGSPKTRRYLLNKSSNTIIWRLNIRQVNKDLYVEVESPRQVVNQWENVCKCADYSMKKKPA